jgi:hypothetical protein
VNWYNNKADQPFTAPLFSPRFLINSISWINNFINPVSALGDAGLLSLTGAPFPSCNKAAAESLSDFCYKHWDQTGNFVPSMTKS